MRYPPLPGGICEVGVVGSGEGASCEGVVEEEEEEEEEETGEGGE